MQHTRSRLACLNPPNILQAQREKSERGGRVKVPDEELERDRKKSRKEPKDKKPKVAEAPTYHPLEGNDPNDRDRGGPGEDPPLPLMAQLS